MQKAPNLLFIQADQLRFDCIGFSKDYPVHTPNIDKLAEQGMWFTNAYTPIPICSPARQALMNGRRPESFGSLWNHDNFLPTGALDPSEYAWPRELQKAGYRMGFVGKWHIHPEYSPQHYGFDDYHSNDDFNDYRKKQYPTQKFVNGFFGEIDPAELEYTHTHWAAGRAMELIDQYHREGAPWHVSLDFNDPHPPCRPNKAFADRYQAENVPVWRSFNEQFHNKPYIQKQQLHNWGIDQLTWDDWSKTVALYYASITQMDDAVGQVLQLLENLGIGDQTVVIFTSDHGDMCGGHRMMDKHYVMYDDVVKIPLIIKWPAKIPVGTICDKMVYNALDLPPTILEILHLPAPPNHFHGRSLMPLLQSNDGDKKTWVRGEAPNNQTEPHWRDAVVTTYNGQQFGLFSQRMIRNNEWKYIWNLTDVDELYDLEQDPNELDNKIYDEQAKPVIAGFRKQLYEELQRVGDKIVGNQWMKDQLLLNRKL